MGITTRRSTLNTNPQEARRSPIFRRNIVKCKLKDLTSIVQARSYGN
ncbi:hypothetical protein L914_05730 [Phytophthora nicotianae]|uniref:Uncharacterized protein n=1 Tax=Phytophthora nicotianae TaxID=4792 RepID=W2NNR4_PHYNI|nr:hypothetical protein L914_05730 [Phytophthora nicotianae]